MHSRISRSIALALPAALLIALSSCDNSKHELRPDETSAPATPSPVTASQYAAADTTGAVGAGEVAPNLDTQQEPAAAGEGYDPIHENEFTDAARSPLSTFSIDVDAASYTNVRRFINQGTLPPPDAVRIEEMVNYFTYNYPQPSGNRPFTITTETASCPWNDDHQLVLIGLQGKKMEMEHLPPSNLVFLIDVSGSMDEPDKLPLVKRSLGLLVNQLRPEDHVAIVVYAGAAGLVLPSTSGADKGKIRAALDHLEAGGSTAGGEGIVLAYKIAGQNFLPHGNNRVILATDGDFNVGISDQAGLTQLIEAKRSEGIFLTTLGFGTGNLQDGKMEQLADKGNGHYDYVDSDQEAQRIFIGQLGATLLTIAKDVKLQVEFNPELVGSYRLIGYENRMLAAKDFDDDTKDAGELGAGHSVTALYEIVPRGADPGRPRVAPLLNMRGERDGFAPASFGPRELMQVKLRYKQPDGDRSSLIIGPAIAENRAIDEAPENIRFAAAVAEWGMLLRNSTHKGSASYQSVLALARNAAGTDGDGARREFISLVDASRSMGRN